jgi:hypothetical protein
MEENEKIPIEDCIECLNVNLEELKEISELDIDTCVVQDQDDVLTLMITGKSGLICELLGALLFAYGADEGDVDESDEQTGCN